MQYTHRLIKITDRTLDVCLVILRRLREIPLGFCLRIFVNEFHPNLVILIYRWLSIVFFYRKQFWNVVSSIKGLKRSKTINSTTWGHRVQRIEFRIWGLGKQSAIFSSRRSVNTETWDRCMYNVYFKGYLQGSHQEFVHKCGGFDFFQ